jgi:hypothetical protein
MTNDRNSQDDRLRYNISQGFGNFTYHIIVITGLAKYLIYVESHLDRPAMS